MNSETEVRHKSRIRSFVRRPGRMTPAQQRAIDELLPRYRIDPAINDVRRSFDRRAPLVVEIGFGNGDALVAMAASTPGFDFIGIEVHEPGVGRALRAIDQAGLENVRIAMRDAVDVLHEQVMPASIDEFRIYFPDPWPKKRHHKRRLIQPDFVALLADRLVDQGLLHLATDWQPYAEWMVEALDTRTAFDCLGDPYVPRPAWRPETRFEQRGADRGHQIFDLLLRRTTRN